MPRSRLFILLASSIALGLFASGCVTTALRRTRRHLAEGNLGDAVGAARDDRGALREIALEILVGAMGDPATRASAARGLEGAGPQAGTELEELVSSDDAVAGALAAAALLALGDDETIPLLEERLGHPDGQARAAAVRALGPLAGDREFFEHHLRDSDDRVRLAAVAALPRASDEGFPVELLADAARRDPAPAVRGAALRALGRAAPDEVLLEVAGEGLRARALPVRLAAIAAIAQAEDHVAAAALLEGPLLGEEPVEAVRAAAVLATWDDDRGRQHLARALAGSSVTTASAAAVAASQVGASMVEALGTALERSEPEVRMHAAASLLRLDELERAIPALTTLMESPGWLGLQAALALAPARGREARERISRALDAEDPALRAFAALSTDRVSGGLGVVRRAMADDAIEVRVAGATAVLRILRRDG